MSAPEREDTRALLDAVLEALDIPHAATVGDEEARAEILTRRVIDLVVTLRVVADDGCPLGEAIPFLREKLAEHPAVGYLTADELANRRAAGADYMTAVKEGRAAAETVWCDTHPGQHPVTADCKHPHYTAAGQAAAAARFKRDAERIADASAEATP